VKNYFKTMTLISNEAREAGDPRYKRQEQYFFFEDSSVSEVLNALSRATKAGGQLSVWRELLDYPNIPFAVEFNEKPQSQYASESL